MTKIEEYIKSQKQITKNIADLIRNFGKDGPSRKTDEYFIKRIKDLQDYWSTFSSLHKEIEQIVPQGHPYHTEHLYDKTYELYKNGIEMISNYEDKTGKEQTPVEEHLASTPTATTQTPKQKDTESHNKYNLPTETSNNLLVTNTNPRTTIATEVTYPAVSSTAAFPITAVPMVSKFTNITTLTPPVQSYGTPIQTSALPVTSLPPWGLQQQFTPALPHQDIQRVNNFPKLPPVKIPKFNGDYKEWKSFIDIFSNVIHNNPYLSDVEKMQYLIYHVEGDAKRVISHLQLSSNNYNTALELIRARFNNTRKIITTYVNTIIDAKKTEHRCQEDIIMLYDLLRECLEALKNLSCNTDEWGPMIVCIAMRKLDTESLRLFEESLSHPREMPSVQELLQFLEKRYQVLDCIKGSKQPRPDAYTRSLKKTLHTTFKSTCVVCGRAHNIYQCGEFKQMGIEQRHAVIKQNNLCLNCLAHNKTEKCNSTKTCILCKKKHHSLLHRNYEKGYNSVQTPATIDKNNVAAHLTTNTCQRANDSKSTTKDNMTFHTSNTRTTHVLLPTAVVRLKNTFGQIESFRALIDPGSQVSLITEEAVQIMKLQKHPIKATILGVGESESAKISSKVNVKLQLRNKQDTYLSVEALVLSKVNSYLPETHLTGLNIKKYGNMVLADPNCNKPGPIDLLLGADVYASILTEGLKRGQPAAQNTKLGWILFGSIPNTWQETTKLSSFLSLAEIQEKLEKFWQIEDSIPTSQTNDICEEHFRKTHKRNEEGRYVVRLPFKDDKGQLGQSKNIAIARLIQMEKKLSKNPDVQAEYNNFLMEYLALEHMAPAKPYKGDVSKVYYLPHHAVFKKDSTTTKTRVVFDASCKTESGNSLNDLLHSGPKIQQDLTEILLRWRKHRYVYTADIEKMFRQISVAKEDGNYQRILWRQQAEGPIQEFTLNTVTYGTGPASYIAVKTLRQLAIDEGTQLPIGREVLTSDFYIDDMLTGANTKQEARELQKQIILLMKKGGFNLRKWTSNDEELLSGIPEDIIEKGILEIKEADTIKALGIHWNPKRDELQFRLKLEVSDATLTKRAMLSKIATIFDPLGWLSPVTLTAKLIMQALWRTGADWDEQPPIEIIKAWKNLESELHEIQSLRIPRWINYRAGYQLQLHGFCDASEKGYAAVIYSRTTDSFGKIHTTLLTAKTKVAPLKQKITLPRMELCGALMLARLLKSTVITLGLNSPTVFAWCDSEIVFAWIAKNPNTLHTFVANRISEIQGHFSTDIWKHVSSQENPADVASRGISPSKLSSHKIWWKGPLWLSKPPEAWPSKKFNLITNEEVKRTMKVLHAVVKFSDISNCSTLTHQVRVIAYCQRFINNCRLQKAQRQLQHLSTEELKTSKTCIVKIVQQESFHEEIHTLTRGNPLKKTSKLLSLHPFLDKDGILRVGGRIQNANLSADAKHQILLPQNHNITNLIIDHAHLQTLHGGTQLTLNYLRMQYWVINSKSRVQARIHRCITCLRHQQNCTQQLMGNLPTIRITPSPPFSHCGVDYAGPFLTKMSKGRGTKTIKGYISLFVCMVTKAVHLELVSDLTTDGFLAAYKRFVARRGICKEIYSDNGTNFVGARNKMTKELKLAINHSTRQAAEVLANDGTEWKFIPPGSPHFGGLWEAGVKSVKGHLKRVLGDTLLTYEEFSTVLCQVEACLNSRPICQQSSDPTDLEPLTPGHFLIGRPIIAPPEPDISNTQVHQRWKLVTKLQQDIWKRWSQEYLSLLQQRSKWKTENNNPNIGELVLVKDDNLPPQKWSLGRIVQLHPGEDGIVRIVSVKYKNDIKKRPLNKLCQLPIDTYNTSGAPELKKLAAVTTLSNARSKAGTTSRRLHISNAYPEPELWSRSEHFDQPSTSAIKHKADDLPTSPIKRRKIRIAPCTWATRLLHSVFIILFWITTVFGQDYEIFQPKTGLYIEKLGSAQIKRGNLRLQITFPTNEVIEDQKMIDTTWIQIRDMCEKTKTLTDVTHCDILFQHMSARRQNLLKATDEIIHLAQHKTRGRRGLLGDVLTSIFGVNDKVYTDLELLQHNQEGILQTTNQQVLLINSKINQSNYIIEEKLKQLDSRLSQVMASINEMATWYSKADHNRISIEVISTYLSTEDYYDELAEKYERWLNAIHQHGHLLNFVTPNQINKAIEDASAKLGSNLLISGTPQPRLEIKAENNTLKLYGYLNIIERNLYELIHVTPLPQMISNSSFAIIDLKLSTFAVNFDHQLYFNLKEEELKACSMFGDHSYLCTPTIVHSIDDSPSCIVDELYNRHTASICEMRKVQLTGAVWKALMMKNTWLYITKDPKVVAIICKGTRKELLLNATGIIHLHDDCSLKTREITLKTAIDEQFEVVTSHIKQTSPVTTEINTTHVSHILQSGVLIHPSQQIMDYTLAPDLPYTNTIHKALAVHTVTTTSLLICVLLAICMYKYWSKLKQIFKPVNNNHPSTHSSQAESQPSIQQRFDRVLASARAQHVHPMNNNSQF